MARSSALLFVLAAPLLAQQGTPDVYPDAPYVPTPFEVVEQMLKLAGVHAGDTVYDLGCGDGRIVIIAAQKFVAYGMGVEIDPERIRAARQNAEKAGTVNNVKFVQSDLFQVDLRPATVVTLYLLPALNEKLKPKLLSELKPGSRVVSFAFDMGDWKPAKTVEMDGRRIFLWVIPDKAK